VASTCGTPAGDRRGGACSRDRRAPVQKPVVPAGAAEQKLIRTARAISPVPPPGVPVGVQMEPAADSIAQMAGQGPGELISEQEAPGLVVHGSSLPHSGQNCTEAGLCRVVSKTQAAWTDCARDSRTRTLQICPLCGR